MSISTFFHGKPVCDPLLLELKSELKEARQELSIAYDQLDQVSDSDLIDACIYRINAARCRCNYLIRAVKAQEATTPQHNEHASGERHIAAL